MKGGAIPGYTKQKYIKNYFDFTGNTRRKRIVDSAANRQQQCRARGQYGYFAEIKSSHVLHAT
jgi:hypothetical protein